MDRILVRQASEEGIVKMLAALNLGRSIDGDLFDPGVLDQQSTFVLEAFTPAGVLGWLPVQQPLMLESFIRTKNLDESLATQALTRLTEHAVEECFKRDAGEVYFLSRNKETLEFSERHLFTPLPNGLQVRRLNLLEAFGA